MSTKQLKNKIIKQAGPLSKPEDENNPGFNEVDKAKEQYQKAKAKTEKSEKSKKEDKSESANTDTIKTFIDNLKKQGWKLNHNKSTKITSLEKTIQLDKASFDFKYVILNSAFNIYTQNVIYSPKTTYSKILSNIILEQQNKTLDLEVKIYKVWREKTENSTAGSSSIIISTDLKNIPLNIKSDQLIKKIQELVKEYDKSQKNDSASSSTQTQTKSKPKSKTKKDSTSSTASTQTQTKNSQKPVQKTEDKTLSKRDMKMIASIIDTLQQEEVEALQHKYPILNMYN